MATAESNPFDSLPIETNQHIASYLEYDGDICTFRLICQSTHSAVDADNFSFWRRRFLTQFETPGWPQANNIKYKHAYQRRRAVLKNGASFRFGESSKEKACLEVLRDLIVESYCSKSKNTALTYNSLNMEHIRRFISSNDLLQIIFKPMPSRRRSASPPNPTALLSTLQALCAPMLLSFDQHIVNFHYGFPDSQSVVYSTPSTHSVFTGCHGLDVNMAFVLHNLNFWKYHMVREDEHTLCGAFSELDDDEMPRWWSSQLKQSPQQLGKHWKGSYAYVDRSEIETIRRGRNVNEQIQDRFAGEEDAFNFQDMQLQLVDEGENFPWPLAFEKHLRALTPPVNKAKTRAQKRSAAPEEVANLRPVSFHFEGEGKDTTEEFFASGWLNPLPPQQGVPGWQRMTMMKYFEDDNNSIDEDGLWAYEGVVLPGGQIILGRWWSPSDGDENMYSGPFILWCVDGPKYEVFKALDEV